MSNPEVFYNMCRTEKFINQFQLCFSRRSLKCYQKAFDLEPRCELNGSYLVDSLTENGNEVMTFFE